MARAIHQLSGRALKAFAVLNCAALPDGLIESELFGYSRGAFTGAVQNYRGRILSAQGGTLFLDEIGELPLGAQSKLLRFLEQKEIQRLGSHLGAFEQSCREGEHAGRKLDFIAQEMLREANTIASKANDAEIAKRIVEIKGAIDRLKEQVQNVE